jgi:predicted lipid carrier protein YhbT
MKVENGNFNLTQILGLLLKPFIPNSLIQFSIDNIVNRFNQRHPFVIKKMQVFKDNTIALEPTDLPFAFVASFHPTFKIRLVEKNSVLGNVVSLKAPLNIFLDMLSSTQDGDALFFARKLEVRGDTTSIVALRNIIESENLSIESDLKHEFGVFYVLIKTLIGVYLDIDDSLNELKSSIVKEVHGNVSYANIKLARVEEEVRELKLDLHKTKQKLSNLRLKKHE